MLCNEGVKAMEELNLLSHIIKYIYIYIYISISNMLLCPFAFLSLFL